jgi:hypothetical protein
VVLSIFLRQKGSPQSKPVDAPHAETEDWGERSIKPYSAIYKVAGWKSCGLRHKQKTSAIISTLFPGWSRELSGSLNTSIRAHLPEHHVPPIVILDASKKSFILSREKPLELQISHIGADSTIVLTCFVFCYRGKG